MPAPEATGRGAAIAVLRRRWATASDGVAAPGRTLAALTACGLASGIAESLVVVLVVRLVSAGAGPPLPLIGDVAGTGAVAAATFVVLAVLGVAHAVGASLAVAAAVDVQRSVQTKLMSAFLDAPWLAQSQARAGELQDLVSVRAHVVSDGIQDASKALGAALNLAAVIAVAVAVSPVATVGLLLAVAVVVGVSSLLQRGRRHAIRRASQAHAALAMEVTEIAGLTRELRVFGVDGTAAGQLRRRIDEAARLQGRMRLARSRSPLLIRDVTVALIVLALTVVAAVDGPGPASLGVALVLVLRALSHAQSLVALGAGWTERQESLERIRARLAAWQAPAARGSADCPRVTQLALRGVGFRYPTGDGPALGGVDLDLRRGELVGIIGRTGAGKSTLAGVLLGLLEPSHGTVAVDGVPLAQLCPRAWHARTAWVAQEPRLLTGTVADNVRFLREAVDDDAIRRAATAAGLDGELRLEQPVGPGGVALSGGQRQRIALARALVGDPDLVVLDEPTSALDLHTEASVSLAVERLRADRLVVVIAHRPSTIRMCDRLVALDGGRLRAVLAPTALEDPDASWLRAALQPAPAE